MSGRCESPVLVRAEALAALTRSDRDKVDTLLAEMRWLKEHFREDPFDSKKRIYAAMHWTLEKLGVIEPKVEPERFSVYEKYVGWVSYGSIGDVVLRQVGLTGSGRFEGSRAQADTVKRWLIATRPGPRYAVAPTPAPVNPTCQVPAFVAPEEPGTFNVADRTCIACGRRIGDHDVTKEGLGCPTKTESAA